MLEQAAEVAKESLSIPTALYVLSTVIVAMGSFIGGIFVWMMKKIDRSDEIKETWIQAVAALKEMVVDFREHRDWSRDQAEEVLRQGEKIIARLDELARNAIRAP